MVSKYNYYTGIIFKAYTYGVGDAIVKGGRYDKLLEKFGKTAPAIGFMIVIDDLTTALKAAGKSADDHANRVVILYKEEELKEVIAKANALRSEGNYVSMIPYRPEQKDEILKFIEDAGQTACIL